VATAPNAAPEAKERVLSTLNQDGSRRWIRPRLSKGRFLRRRMVVGWGLILLFTAIPYLRMNGKPLMLFDIPRREFTLFGTTFLPTDTMLLMLLMLSIFVTIFLLTSLFGRVWCGWGCPQTVYMELVYRPIERWLEGNQAQQMKLDREGANARRMIKFVIYLFVSMFLAHTFLAYFVGVETLFRWIRRSPVEHPLAFVIMAGVTLLMLADFGYFREQVCIVACPYGRFQSVLLDRRSLIVGYDPKRGEPRGKRRKGADTSGLGDCIDCGACVTTCPTGIDIREGLQMECVNCTQCIDACDAIMDRVGKPRGLVRYSSQETLETGKRKILRPRVIAYPMLLALLVGALGFSVAEKEPADVTVLRGIGVPFVVLPSGEVSNQLRVKIVNRREEPLEYLIELADGEGLKIVSPQNPLPVAARKTETATVFVVAPRDVFDDGALEVTLRVSDGAGFSKDVPYRLLGPSSPTGAGS
jgi:cytochrome c oxidase accessory protein FixG